MKDWLVWLYKKIVNRKTAADTMAMIVFSIVVGMTVELAIVGMTIWESVWSRGMSIPLNALTGKPQAAYRDKWMRRLKVEEGTWIRQAIADACAFSIFQTPIYICTLWLAGANLHQIIVACSTMVFIFAFVSIPYGWTVTICRMLWRVPPKSE